MKGDRIDKIFSKNIIRFNSQLEINQTSNKDDS